jgi:hypothetical protein
VESTLNLGLDVDSTLTKRSFNIVCLLGRFLAVQILLLVKAFCDTGGGLNAHLLAKLLYDAAMVRTGIELTTYQL